MSDLQIITKYFFKHTYHLALYKIFISSPNHAKRTRRSEKKFCSCKRAHYVQIGLNMKFNEFLPLYVIFKTRFCKRLKYNQQS